MLVANKIEEQYPKLRNHYMAQYFSEVSENLIVDEKHYQHTDKTLESLNVQFKTKNYKDVDQNIGVIYAGKQAPGGNNVCDGLLRFQEKRPKAKLLGFLGGVNGFLEGSHIEITRETYKYFHNCGGYDYLGRSIDVLNSPDQL